MISSIDHIEPTKLGSWQQVQYSALPYIAPFDCFVRIYSNPDSTANAYDIYTVNGSTVHGIRNNSFAGQYEVGETILSSGSTLDALASDNIRSREIYVKPLAESTIIPPEQAPLVIYRDHSFDMVPITHLSAKGAYYTDDALDVSVAGYTAIGVSVVTWTGWTAVALPYIRVDNKVCLVSDVSQTITNVVVRITYIRSS